MASTARAGSTHTRRFHITEETATPGSGAARPHLLDEGECLALLASQQVGRLAFVAERAVVVVPVNFRLNWNRPVFRVEQGGTIETVVSDAAVGFQVDSIHERAADPPDLPPGLRLG